MDIEAIQLFKIQLACAVVLAHEKDGMLYLCTDLSCLIAWTVHDA